VKKILVPTDFSDLGDYAYNVASKIAKSTESEIITLSVLPGPPGAFYSTSGALLNDDGDDYSEWQKRLAEKKSQMVDWIKDKTDVSDSICTIGEIDKTILFISEQNEIDLVVMGTEGLFNKTAWSKPSHTEYISNHAHVPVLSLKCDRSDLDLTQIVFVSDFLENKVLDLKIFKNIQEVFQSKIQLLTIKTPKGARSKDEIFEDMKSFAGLNMIDNYECNVYEDSNVEAGIGKFCAEHDIDLIVLGTHQSKGFSRLFKHSVSDDIVHHLFHPILTFPIH
jgi:nucleotide-binding universal stress UspA family protein